MTWSSAVAMVFVAVVGATPGAAQGVGSPDSATGEAGRSRGRTAL